MIVHRLGFRVRMIGALVSGVLLAATATAEQPPQRPCQKLTGAARTECERQNRKEDRERQEAPPPQATPADPPPPDTKSDGNDQSDTADPPRG